MADEQTRAPYNRPPIVPPKLGWASLLAQEITDDLQTALEQFSAVAAELKAKA